MTVTDIERRIEEIKAADGDDEQQHSLEDALLRAVLTAISLGNIGEGETAGDLAHAALKVRDVEYARWSA